MYIDTAHPGLGLGLADWRHLRTQYRDLRLHSLQHAAQYLFL